MSKLSPLNRQRRSPLRIDPRNPEGVAECDGCGFWVNYPELREKQEYRGGWSPVGTGLFVCKTCDDVPQPYYRRQVLAPDPVPLLNPRLDRNVTQPILISATTNTATTLATQQWIDQAFPPASTATNLYITTASALGQQGWFGGGA